MVYRSPRSYNWKLQSDALIPLIVARRCAPFNELLFAILVVQNLFVLAKWNEIIKNNSIDSQFSFGFQLILNLNSLNKKIYILNFFRFCHIFQLSNVQRGVIIVFLILVFLFVAKFWRALGLLGFSVEHRFIV